MSLPPPSLYSQYSGALVLTRGCYACYHRRGAVLGLVLLSATWTEFCGKLLADAPIGTHVHVCLAYSVCTCTFVLYLLLSFLLTSPLHCTWLPVPLILSPPSLLLAPPSLPFWTLPPSLPSVSLPHLLYISRLLDLKMVQLGIINYLSTLSMVCTRTGESTSTVHTVS